MCRIISSVQAEDLDRRAVLRDAELGLRRRADHSVREALRVAVLQLAGYRPAEIRARLALDETAYAYAHAWLSEALHESGSSR